MGRENIPAKNKNRAFSIGYRISLNVSAIALMVVVIIALGIFYYSYRVQVQGIEENLRKIENRAIPQITTSIWDFAEKQLESEFGALCKIQHVSHVAITGSEPELSYGVSRQGDVISRQFELVHIPEGTIGTLSIQFSLASARQSVFSEGLRLAGYVLIPLLTMAIATLLMFRNLVTRPLDALAEYTGSLSVDTLDRVFRFRRRSSPQPDELDRLLNAINTMRTNMLEEIRVRHETERQLSETEVHYREVFNSTGDAILIHDAKTGEILDVNETMLDMYGYSYEEALASSVVELSGSFKGQSPEEVLRRVSLAAGGEPQVFQWLAKRKNDEAFWVEVFLKKMTPSSRGRILASIRDISARKTAEEKLFHIQKMETIGQLAGGIAHDFNNILTGILGAAEMISSETDNPEILRDVDMIINTVERAGDLTGQLLAFARRGPVVLALQDIHEIIKDACLILQRSIDKRIILGLALDSTASQVKGDRSQLQAAILNLCLNARDAMPDGGKLTISTTSLVLDESYCQESPFPLQPGDFLEICLSDTGEGMSETVLKKAFEPFFTTKKVGKGTGLGLASVYGTVESHSGAIELSSQPGQGTSIRLMFPLSESTADPVPVDAKEIQVGNSCILVIDDEESVLKTTQLGLEKIGYRVFVAKDGQEGCEIYERHSSEIDVVVLDMIMPKKNGQETFLEIRSINPQARILLASGFSQNEAVTSLLAQGDAGFLRKPYKRSVLIESIENLLA